jgi:Fungal specific transcription factor domain
VAALPRRPSDMELTAGEVRNTLIEQYFPAADSGAAPFAEWLLHTLDLSPWGELLETALLALTMARLSKAQNNSKMNLQGRLKYGKALNLLQQALLDSQQSMEDQTLAACNVLKFYEVITAFAAFSIDPRIEFNGLQDERSARRRRTPSKATIATCMVSFVSSYTVDRNATTRILRGL